jgi:hypothetical protein
MSEWKYYLHGWEPFWIDSQDHNILSNKSTKKMYMLYMYLLFHLLVVTCDILVDRVKRGSIILFWNGMNKRRWLCNLQYMHNVMRPDIATNPPIISPIVHPDNLKYNNNMKIHL